jgi:hypothetical protein
LLHRVPTFFWKSERVTPSDHRTWITAHCSLMVQSESRSDMITHQFHSEHRMQATGKTCVHLLNNDHIWNMFWHDVGRDTAGDGEGVAWLPWVVPQNGWQNKFFKWKHLTFCS